MIRYRRDLWKLVENVPGYLAEIGVAEGYFSREMLQWPLADAPRIYLVDRWACVPTQKGDSANSQKWHEANYEEMLQKTDPFSQRVEILRGDSVEMARFVPDRSFRLVYLDADHSLEGVRRDIAAWVPKLGPNGVLAGHDFLNENYGVKQAVDEYCVAHKLTLNLIAEDKNEDAGFWFRMPYDANPS